VTRDEVDALNAQDPTTPLTDDDIERMLAHYRSKEYLSESGGGWKPRAAMLELQRHRAAKAANKERVRAVVDGAAVRVLSALENYETHDEAAHAIAARAAEQLATSSTVMQNVRGEIAKRHDRALVHETVRQAVLHFRSAEYALAAQIAERADKQLAKQARRDADEVSQTVRDVIATVSSLSGEHYPQRAIEDIATRVAIALTGKATE
jgi:hypothetical protein